MLTVFTERIAKFIVAWLLLTPLFVFRRYDDSVVVVVGVVVVAVVVVQYIKSLVWFSEASS